MAPAESASRLDFSSPRASASQQPDITFETSPNPIALGFLIFFTCVATISGLVGLALFIHRRRTRTQAVPPTLRRSHGFKDLEAYSVPTVQPKLRVASTSFSEKNTSLSLVPNTSSPKPDTQPNGPLQTENPLERNAFSLDYYFSDDPQRHSDSLRDNNTRLDATNEHCSIFSSPVTSDISSISFKSSDIRYACELFVKLEERQNEIEPKPEPQNLSEQLSNDEPEPTPVSFFEDITTPLPAMPTVRVGSGLIVFTVFMAAMSISFKNKDKLRHLPPLKRQLTRTIAGVRHTGRIAKSSSPNLKKFKTICAGYLPRVRHNSLSPKKSCMLISARLFLRTPVKAKSQSTCFNPHDSFLEISTAEIERDITDEDVIPSSPSTVIKYVEQLVVNTKTISEDESISFFSWDESTAIENQTLSNTSITGPSNKGKESSRIPLGNSTVGNLPSGSWSSGIAEAGSDSTIGSLLGKTTNRATSTLKKVSKTGSPKPSTSVSLQSRVDNLLKKQKRRSISTDLPVGSNSSGADLASKYGVPTLVTPQSPALPNISIEINGEPAGEHHFASSFYASLSPPCSPSTTPLSPQLLNVDWTPRPSLRECTVLVSMRLTGRTFGSLRGRSLGCYATIDSTLASIKSAVEEQLGCDVVLRGMVRPSTMPAAMRRIHEKNRRNAENAGEDEWVYATIVDDKMFSKWVEERVLADGEGASLDVCKAFS